MFLRKPRICFPLLRRTLQYNKYRFYNTRLNRIIQESEQIVGTSNLTTNLTTRKQHGEDLSYHTPSPPDIVVFPETTEQVQELAKLCTKYKFPIIPFGAGSSLEGHVCALQGGMCLDLSKMNRVVELNAEDMDVTVEAGMTREELNSYIRDTGLFFPIDPGANATIGGMVATRASGTNAVRYGTMKENVLNLKVVLPNGDVMKTANRAKKSSAGYDLTSLFIGSEGTLGIVTEVTVKLYGIPEAISSAVCSFPDIESAANSVIRTIQYGVPIARVELLDPTTITAVNKYSGLSIEEKPTLFFEFHGTESSVKAQSDLVQEISSEFGGSNFKWATDPEERAKLWKARHNAYFASTNLQPGKSNLITDVCVPISRLADCISETKKDLDASGLFYTLFGHAGDGNFHVIILFDKENEQELKKVKELNHRLVLRGISMDGTATGEHGVGSGKIKYLLEEHGPVYAKLMRELKKTIDPLGIMNPGKMLPTEEEIEMFTKGKSIF